jgi:hypothetical protein
MVQQPGFFNMSDRLRELSAKGDDLGRIAAQVDFQQFRPQLERALPRSDGSEGGRPGFDRVLMFKVLLLQAMHGLSDERCDYLIKDRLSFMRFLGRGLADLVSDANTIWTFREALKQVGAVDALFALFDATLRISGYLAIGGQIVDATIVAAPKQRNTEGEREAIRAGMTHHCDIVEAGNERWRFKNRVRGRTDPRRRPPLLPRLRAKRHRGSMNAGRGSLLNAD